MKNSSKTVDKKVWVEVEVNKYTDGITVFRGLMSKADLDAWSRGELVDCAVKLEKTYWFSEESVCILGKGDDNVRHYTGDSYIRVDTIMLVFTLKDDSIPSKSFSQVDNVFLFPGRNKQ